MTSLERAKSFLQRKARVIALTAIPLASLVAIAPTAKAGAVTNPVLNPTSCTPNFSGSNFSSSGCSTAALAQGPNLLTGVKLFGTASVSDTISGGGVQLIGLGFFASGSGNGGIFAGGTIPVDWSFSTTVTGNANPDLTWVLTLNINNTVVYNKLFAISPGLITGSDVTDALPAGPINSYSINFGVNDNEAVQGETLTVTVPSNSVNINTAATSAPEPGTFALLGSALAGIGSLAWRRRAQVVIFANIHW